MELAWADPVDLTIRTNYEFSYVVDCISQALLWIYFEEDTKKLRSLSIRGAQEVRTMIDELEGTDSEEAKTAAKTLQAIAKMLGIEQNALRRTLEEVAYDPYTEFFCDVWEERRRFRVQQLRSSLEGG